MNSTPGTVKHRFQTAIANDPTQDVSATEWNDSEVVDSAEVDGAIMVRDSTQTDGWGFQARRSTIFLGGSRAISLPLASGVVQDAIDFPPDIELNGGDYGDLTTTIRVDCRVDDAATAITPKLRNITAGVDAGVGVICSGTAADYSGTNSKQTITVALANGLNKYRLQGTPSNALHPTYMIGNLIIGG